MLEMLWPPGHGIPGPHVTQSQLREAVNIYGRSVHKGNVPYKEYIDVFRRMRELQGNEGIIGIGKAGVTYQLVDFEQGPKIPLRKPLTRRNWGIVVQNYDSKCAVCRRMEPEVRFDHDHKIPRSRGGGDELHNLQPLCGECNNLKSTLCRGCRLDCLTCSWAFPEKYRPIRVNSENITLLRDIADKMNTDPNDLANSILAEALKDNH